jgi:hypothetical protein
MTHPVHLRIFLAVAFLLGLLPIALCISLWSRLGTQTIPRWRLVLSMIGLALATAASAVPPLWFATMLMLPQNSDATPYPRLLSVLFLAVFGGLAAVVPAVICLSFGMGKVRWAGLASCVLSLSLFALSLGTY